MQKEKTKSGRFRQAKKLCDFRSIEKKIKKAKKKHKGATKTEINKILSCAPNYIGCYAENELENLIINSFPCFLIVNIDHSGLPGSHWISLQITQTKIEIWDSLGFRLLDWPRIPCFLLNFLHKHVVTRKIIVSKKLQGATSVLCGYYCIFFIISRPLISFHELNNYFSSDLSSNDDKLIKFFS